MLALAIPVLGLILIKAIAPVLISELLRTLLGRK